MKARNFLIETCINIIPVQVQTAEDETERMRAELLRKEQELLELKRLEVEMQINKYKMEMEQVTIIAFITTVRLLQYLSSDLLINEINMTIIRFNVTSNMVKTYRKQRNVMIHSDMNQNLYSDYCY